MKSLIEYAARALGYMEKTVLGKEISYRACEPHIALGERYQNGYFDGSYPESEHEQLPHRYVLKVIRNLHGIFPFYETVPVNPPAHTLERDNLVIEMTRAMYDEGKALYTRENIQSVEDQLDAYDATLCRRRGSLDVRRLLSRCSAPQMAWVKYTDFDGVVHHQATSMNNSFNSTRGDDGLRPVYSRAQIVFRTIQELTMPDPVRWPENAVFANDQWVPSIAFQSMHVAYQILTEGFQLTPNHGEEINAEDLITRLDRHRKEIKKSDEWHALMKLVEVTHPENDNLRAIDKIVYFYCRGMNDNCGFCQRATYLLALATCIRELIIIARQEHHRHSRIPTVSRPPSRQESACPSRHVAESDLDSEPFKAADPSLNQPSNGPIPIYMPACGYIRRWNANELTVLRQAGVVTIPSNGRLFLKVDANSAVLSYRNENPVKQVVTDLARPAMMICKPPVKSLSWSDFAWREVDRLGESIVVPYVRPNAFDNSILETDPDSPRVCEMLDCGDKEEEEELDGRFVGQKRPKRKGDYWKVGNVPTLPGDTADKETLTMYLRRRDAKKEAGYWT